MYFVNPIYFPQRQSKTKCKINKRIKLKEGKKKEKKKTRVLFPLHRKIETWRHCSSMIASSLFPCTDLTVCMLTEAYDNKTIYLIDMSSTYMVFSLNFNSNHCSFYLFIFFNFDFASLFLDCLSMAVCFTLDFLLSVIHKILNFILNLFWMLIFYFHIELLWVYTNQHFLVYHLAVKK